MADKGIITKKTFTIVLYLYLICSCFLAVGSDLFFGKVIYTIVSTIFAVLSVIGIAIEVKEIVRGKRHCNTE